jgi:hypothetical protein
MSNGAEGFNFIAGLVRISPIRAAINANAMKSRMSMPVLFMHLHSTNKLARWVKPIDI